MSLPAIRAIAVEDPQDRREALTITTIVCDDHPTFARGLAKLLEAEVHLTDSTVLGDQEREILSCIAKGQTNRDIAARLHVSKNRGDAAVVARGEGLA